MKFAGEPSWQISESRGEESFDLPLWIRAAERIDVPADSIVPGPADLDPLPEPSTGPADAAELAAGWRAWWRGITEIRLERPPTSPAETLTGRVTGGPPDFAGLAEWPALQRVVAARWTEALGWPHSRENAIRAYGDGRSGQVVRDLEQELGRPAQPFRVSFVVVSVRDDQVRQLRPDAYLVPERLRDGPAWPDLLRALLRPVA